MRLELTEIARADLKSIRRYSQRAWGTERTDRYMQALRDTMKGLVGGTTVTRPRDDIRPDLRMAVSGRHCVFLEVTHECSCFASCTSEWTIRVICNRTKGNVPTAERAATHVRWRRVARRG